MSPRHRRAKGISSRSLPLHGVSCKNKVSSENGVIYFLPYCIALPPSSARDIDPPLRYHHTRACHSHTCVCEPASHHRSSHRRIATTDTTRSSRIWAEYHLFKIITHKKTLTSGEHSFCSSAGHPRDSSVAGHSTPVGQPHVRTRVCSPGPQSASQSDQPHHSPMSHTEEQVMVE